MLVKQDNHKYAESNRSTHLRVSEEEKNGNYGNGGCGSDLTA